MMVPDVVPNASHPAFSLAVHDTIFLEVVLIVTDPVVAVVPRSIWSGETSSHELSRAASNMESTSTGEEELQAAAIAGHTTPTMAARSARLTDDFT